MRQAFVAGIWSKVVFKIDAVLTSNNYVFIFHTCIINRCTRVS